MIDQVGGFFFFFFSIAACSFTKFGACEGHAAAASVWHPGNDPHLSRRLPLEVEDCTFGREHVINCTCG